MATLKDIDHDRDISITPAIRTKIDDPLIVNLARERKDPNLLKCDSPVVEHSIVLKGSHARRFLEWLATTPWGTVLEKDLQSMTETAKGEPLLSTWLDLARFEQLANDAHAAGALPQSLQSNFADWRSLGIGNVYLDGFSLAG